MNDVNKTLYIPLYGKAFVSRKKLFLRDEKAEKIWDLAQFPLKGKARSKWLAYYMGIRSAVFDEWLKEQLMEQKRDGDTVTVLHIGCGLDSRILRVGERGSVWFDVDFPEVISERRRYYVENASYKMIGGDARSPQWVRDIPQTPKAVVVMEGVAMYLTSRQIRELLEVICQRFDEVSILMDCYTEFAAKASKYRNPVNDVGVMTVYGLDHPSELQVGGLAYVGEREMTPGKYVDELCGMERTVFGKLYAGSFSKKLYKLYEFRK